MKRESFVSNLDLLKDLLGKEEELSEREIRRRLKEDYNYAPPDEEFITAPLRKQEYFVKVKRKWKIDYEKLPEHKAAREILGTEGKLLSYKTLKSKIAKKLKLPVSRVFFFPHKDSTLKGYEPTPNGLKEKKSGDPKKLLWGLAEWKLVNDLIYEIFSKGVLNKNLPKRAYSYTEMLKRAEDYLAKQGIKGEILIFEPEKDARFEKYKKKWVLKEWEITKGKEEETQIFTTTIKKNIRTLFQEHKDELVDLILKRDKPVSIEVLISSVAPTVDSEHQHYPYYVEVFSEELSKVEEIQELSRHRWISKELLPENIYESLEIFEPYAVNENFPILDNEFLSEVFKKDLETSSLAGVDGEGVGKHTREITFVLTQGMLYHGVIKVPAPLRSFFTDEEEGEICLLDFNASDYSYKVWYNVKTGLIFGLKPFFHTFLNDEVGRLFSITKEGRKFKLEDKRRIINHFKSKLEFQPSENLRESLESIFLSNEQPIHILDIYATLLSFRYLRRRTLWSLMDSFYAYQPDKTSPERFYFDEKKVDLGMKKSKEFLIYGAERFFVLEISAEDTESFTLEPEKVELVLEKRGKEFPEKGDFCLLITHDKLFGTLKVNRSEQLEKNLWVIEGEGERLSEEVHISKLTEKLDVKVEDAVFGRLFFEKAVMTDAESIHEILSIYDQFLVEKMGITEKLVPFEYKVMEPALSQKAKDEIKILEKNFSAGKSGGLMSLISGENIYWRLSNNFTYEELKKVLEEKFYDEGFVKLDQFFASLYEALSPRLTDKFLISSTCDGAGVEKLFDYMTSVLKTTGYLPSKEGIRVQWKGEELLLEWEKVVRSDKSRQEYLAREKVLSVHKLLSYFAKNNLLVCEKDELHKAITSLRMRLKDYPEIQILNVVPGPYLHKIVDKEPNDEKREALKNFHSYDFMLIDGRRKKPGKSIEKINMTAPYLKNGALIVIILEEEKPIKIEGAEKFASTGGKVWIGGFVKGRRVRRSAIDRVASLINSFKGE